VNLREDIEAGLALTLEDPDGYGLPVILIDPDGVEYDDIEGQIVYESISTDEAGNEVIDHRPVVTVRRSSLVRVPLATDAPLWACRIPITPSRTATKGTFLIEQPAEDGGSIGYISFRLTRAEQSS